MLAADSGTPRAIAPAAGLVRDDRAVFELFQRKETTLITHRRNIPAALLAAGALLSARHAGADEAVDEIVVYGKRPVVTVEIDRAAMRVDVARHLDAVSASLERAAGRNAHASRVASSPARPRG